jgi:hypothetical protein
MQQSAKKFVFLLTGTLLLLLPALINGYPMIYSDTSTYLASGFEMQPPMDRPMTYGLFIRIFSLNGLSLWPVIFMQCFILVWLMYQLTGAVLTGNQKFRDFVFLAVTVVASFSGAGWASCYLIPDIFTPIMVLSALLILLPPAGKKNTTIYFVIYGFSTAMHSSHIPIGITLLSVILLIRLLRGEKFRALIRVRPVIILMVITLATILSMGSSLSKSKHVFLMGAFIEQGIIKPYLDQNCDSDAYNLCAYKDSLPDQAWQFIWQDSSPLYKLGGWKETKEEFKKIIRGTFFSPKFLYLHLVASVKTTAVQLVRFEALNYTGVAPNAGVLQSRVEGYVPHDIKRFVNSRQNLGLLGDFKWLNQIQLSLILLSLFAAVMLFTFSGTLRNNQLLVLTGMILLLGVFINAWVCGTFANPINRLGNRMTWLIPAYTMLLFLWLKTKAIKKTT